jgi:DNA-binding SARP family transcriptional activator/Tfp pilus assembly protein PilF
MVLFRMLGPLEVRTGQEWIGVSAPKWRTVLAVLLLNHGEVVSTDRLIAEVWGERPPSKATNLVSIHVHRLRRLIDDAQGRILVTRAPGYQIRLAPGDLDAERFSSLAVAGRSALSGGDGQRAADLLTEALGLWRGQALADVPPSALVSAEADRLEESRIEALELRIQADLACGRQAQVVAEVRRLLADNPIREGLWALLIRALYSSGRQAEALEVYARARQVIADELGVDPSAELQRLYQQILAAEAGQQPPDARTQPGADSPFADSPFADSPAESPGGTFQSPGPAEPLPLVAQLPADIPDFTGRAEHVQNLRDLLSGPQRPDSPGAVVVAAVIGTGGLGKTTLAVHAAHLLRVQFPGGQLYANLLGATQHPASPGDVLARFLRDLGMDPSRIPADEEERGAQYRSRLAERRVLIVLDDARDAAQVRPLLPGSASCAVLVTTRSRMPDLAGSRFVDLDVLQLDEARIMFANIVGAGRAEAEPDATNEVLAACAGLPLAIRIAGARLAARGGWTVRSMAARLSNERRRLDELKTGDLAVRACFEVSFSSLPGRNHPNGIDPAHAFRLLGVWQGLSIGLPAAAALLGQPEEAVADALEVLVDAQLLQSPAPDRYRLHDLLRAYAGDRAIAEETQDARDDAVRRVLVWYLHTVDAVAQMVSPYRYQVPLAPLEPVSRTLEFETVEQALNWCEAERANLVTATRQAAATGLRDLAWQLPVASQGFFNRRTYWADWVETHRIALASVRQLGDRLGEALVLNNLGMVFARRRMDEATGYFEQALAIRREIKDLPGEAQTASNIADTYLRLHRFDEALDLLKRALEIHRQVSHAYGEGVALNNLGEAYLALGRIDEAVGYLEQAHQMFGDIDEVRGEGYALNNLGQAYLALGRVDDAIRSLERALELRRALGDRLDEAQTLRDLGTAHVAGRRPDEARRLMIQSCTLFEELGDEAQVSALRSQIAAFSDPTEPD